jgi:hypothetical protein
MQIFGRNRQERPLQCRGTIQLDRKMTARAPENTDLPKNKPGSGRYSPSIWVKPGQ